MGPHSPTMKASTSAANSAWCWKSRGRVGTGVRRRFVPST